MIALLDTSEDLKVCEAELGCAVEQLLTPLTRFSLQYPDSRFAIDNGAFASFDPDRFRGLLDRERDRQKSCRFVSAPDVVGSARRTLEVFDHWYAELQPQHWPLALVAQDGQENLSIPWDRIAAVFIGGTTQWKLGHHAVHVIKAAKAIGKWVHVGRVDKRVDVYDCTVRTERFIEVEVIIREADNFTDRAMYQEQLCEELSQRLGCEVTLIGMHSGVTTEVTCGSE